MANILARVVRHSSDTLAGPVCAEAPARPCATPRSWPTCTSPYPHDSTNEARLGSCNQRASG
eukprot:11122824-Heterocapsa_arctica.AAC.1